MWYSFVPIHSYDEPSRDKTLEETTAGYETLFLATVLLNGLVFLIRDCSVNPVRIEFIFLNIV